jgi:peroxiredoxin
MKQDGPELAKRPANYTPLTPISFLKRAAGMWPDKTAVIDGERRFTYAQFHERCRRLAQALENRGVSRGDTVAILAANSPALLEAHYAVPMLGAVLNPINIRLDPKAIAFCLEHGEATLFLTDRAFAETIETGPAILVFHRGWWCSFCAEQLQTFSALEYDLWRHLDARVLPIAGDPVPTLVEMRDRYDLRLQLLSDPDFSATEAYSGVATHSEHGRYTMAATFVVDTEGVVRFEHLSANTADRVYANYLRYFIRDDYGAAFEDPDFGDREPRLVAGR